MKRQNSYYNIFKYIVSKGETTRREIEKETGYSWGTVSSNVCYLMDDGFIKETRSVINGVGRSTYYLTANGDYVTIGVDINAIGLSCTVSEINGKELVCFLIPFFIKNQKDIINLIYSTFDKGFAWVGNKYKIFSIGLSCQGGVDTKTGYFTRFSFVDHWDSINIKQMLIDRYHVFVTVTNDMTAIAKDYVFKYPNNKDNALIIRLVDGIGFTFTNAGGDASEFIRSDFGHMIMVRDGLQCVCGKKGCLEAYSSLRGIMLRAGLSLFDREKLFSEQYKYQEYIDDAADYLGIAILNVISGYDIKKVILTGRMVEFGERFINRIKESYIKYRNESNLNPDITITVLPNLSASLGVAITSVEEKIENEKD